MTMIMTSKMQHHSYYINDYKQRPMKHFFVLNNDIALCNTLLKYIIFIISRGYFILLGSAATIGYSFFPEIVTIVGSADPTQVAQKRQTCSCDKVASNSQAILNLMVIHFENKLQSVVVYNII